MPTSIMGADVQAELDKAQVPEWIGLLHQQVHLQTRPYSLKNSARITTSDARAMPLDVEPVHRPKQGYLLAQGHGLRLTFRKTAAILCMLFASVRSST